MAELIFRSAKHQTLFFNDSNQFLINFTFYHFSIHLGILKPFLMNYFDYLVVTFSPFIV